MKLQNPLNFLSSVRETLYMLPKIYHLFAIYTNYGKEKINQDNDWMGGK